MKNIFTKHPHKVGENYFQHFIKAVSFSAKLLFIALKVFIHAIFPFLYENTASDNIFELNAMLQKRKDKFNSDDC